MCYVRNVIGKLCPAQTQNYPQATLGASEFKKIVNFVLGHYVNKEIFSSLFSHMFDTQPLENHRHLLIKSVAEKFLQVCFYYAGRLFTAKLGDEVKGKSRQTYTKLIHFTEP